jgi:hypothetical protein
VLGRLRDTSVTSYTIREGLPVDAAVETVPAPGGGVWIGTYGGGVSLLKDGRIATYGAERTVYTGAMWAARDGTLWFGSGSNELLHLRGGKIETVGTEGRYVVALGEDEESLLVALRHTGLWRLRQGRFERYRTPAGKEVTDDYVLVIHRGRDGSLWLGMGGERGRLLHVGSGVAASTDDYPLQARVTSVHDDAEGNIWIATGAGLVRMKDGRLTPYDGVPHLGGAAVASVLEDDSGHLWLNSNEGILRVAKAELNAFAEGMRSPVAVQVFGTQDGLKLEEMRAPTVQRACRTSDGRMWFPTPLGVAVVDPEHLVHDTKAPPIVIESLVVDGKAMAIGEGLEIQAGVEKVEIHYTALTYTRSERASFRYWLEGFDPGWVEGGTQRVAHYTKLPPGSYRFHVRAANSEGVWNQAGASFGFSQRPRFHQTLPFRVALVLLLAVLGVTAHRLRVRQLEARQRELSDKVQEAVTQIKVLRGLLPICASCKKIRTDQGAYVNIEAYVQEHSYAEFSHGVCPECVQALYPHYAPRLDRR